MADQIIQSMMTTSMMTTPEAIKGAARAYEAVGADEFIWWRTVASLDQVDRLADGVA